MYCSLRFTFSVFDPERVFLKFFIKSSKQETKDTGIITEMQNMQSMQMRGANGRGAKCHRGLTSLQFQSLD